VTLAPTWTPSPLLDRSRLPRGATLLGDDYRARRRSRHLSPSCRTACGSSRSPRTPRGRSTARSRRPSRITGNSSRRRSSGGGNGSSRSRITIRRSGSSFATVRTSRLQRGTIPSDPAAVGSAPSASAGVARPRSRQGSTAAQLPRISPARTAAGGSRGRRRECDGRDEALRERRHGR
jgi:hypothetical protein